MNQLDVSSRHDPPKALPNVKSAKVKSVIEINRGTRFAAVIYSDAPEKKVTYPLKVALVVVEDGNWKLAEVQEVGELGYFCGARVLETEVAKGEPVSVLLVYVDEPAGSSNSMAVYSFLVATGKTIQR